MEEMVRARGRGVKRSTYPIIRSIRSAKYTAIQLDDSEFFMPSLSSLMPWKKHTLSTASVPRYVQSMRRMSVFFGLAVVGAACIDDRRPPDPPPAPQPGPRCLGTVGDIDTYPGTFSGTLLGAGADLTTVEGACAAQTGDVWLDTFGEDVVLRLANLEPGQQYGLRLTSDDDLAFYVTAVCPETAGPVERCLNFSDRTSGVETGTFVAEASEHWLVVDTADFVNDGAFQLEVLPAECSTDDQCGEARPHCLDFRCVACLDSFGCGADAPVCDATNACVPAANACVGDDAADGPDGANDGPAVATAVPTAVPGPSANTPIIVTGAICSAPATEQDWFKFALPAGTFGISLDWAGGVHDLDVYLFDDEGLLVASGATDGTSHEAFRADVTTAGDHVLLVTQYAPADTADAVAYSVSIQVPNCTDDFDCPNPAAPVCSTARVCGDGPALCIGDDDGDDGAGDDGPAAARPLASGVPIAGGLCAGSPTEADWFKLDVADAEGLDVSVSWTGGSDLNLVVFDSDGARVGQSSFANPERVRLSYLPAGSYLVRVSNDTIPEATTVTPYSLLASVASATPCASDADCDDEFETQIFRGACDTARGACVSIPAGDREDGATCDSDDDCASGRCSYVLFESDAAKSVCTSNCTSTADCTATLGDGFTCTGLSDDNVCVPACSTDLECGANVLSRPLDATAVWDSLSCNTSTGVCSP